MDNFDNLWDTIDIDNIDISSDNSEDQAQSARAIKKASQISNKQDYEQNIDMDYDKFLDYDNPEGDQTADKSTRWRELITHCEQNFKRMWAKKADEFNYEMNKFKTKQANSQPSSLDKFARLKNHNKLIELNVKRQELVDWAKGKIEDINYDKGRASGFITDDKVGFYSEHPELVQAELATGKYEYQPTTIR